MNNQVNPIAPYAMEVRRALASGKRGLVPALWHLEIANGLATAMWRRDLIGADVDVALATIQATLAQTIDPEIMFISVGEALANARVKLASACHESGDTADVLIVLATGFKVISAPGSYFFEVRRSHSARIFSKFLLIVVRSRRRDFRSESFRCARL